MAKDRLDDTTPDTTGADASDATWDNATDVATADTTRAGDAPAFAGAGQAPDSDLDDAVTRGGAAKSFMHTINVGDPVEDIFNDVPIDLDRARHADVGTATAGGNSGIRGDTDPDLAAVMDRNELDRLDGGGFSPDDVADERERASQPSP